MGDPPLFHVLKPGSSIPGDWCNFPIPKNIEVGENTVVDSSSTFKKFFSELPIGLKLGSNVSLQGTSLATEAAGLIEIGEFSLVSGASIIASEHISIGKYVLIAPGVTIVDTDFHPLDAAARMIDTIAISTIGDKTRRPVFQRASVKVEDDVWIGFNATILKGVTVGRGAVILPGAVVSKDVPPGATAAGNPAQITSLMV